MRRELLGNSRRRTGRGEDAVNICFTKAGSRIAALALLVAVMAGPSAVRAESGIIDTLGVESIAEALKNEGYAAATDSPDQGMEPTVLWKLNGSSCRIMLYDEGHSIQFFVCFSGTSATLDKVNEWNRSRRLSRSYLDEEGDPCLELDLDLAGGITKARLVDYFKTCTVSFEQWHKDVLSE